MASVSMPLAGPSLVTSVAIIAKRSLVKFLRTPQLFWTLTVQGLMFLVLFRYIFGGHRRGGAGVGFVVPGILTTGLIWQGMGPPSESLRTTRRGSSIASAPYPSPGAPCWPDGPRPTR
jgi:ABC-2 type transport system permease protein